MAAARVLLGVRGTARQFRGVVPRLYTAYVSPAASAQPGRLAFNSAAASRRMSTVSKFTLEDPEEMLYPNEDPENGISYDLNWSICGSGVVPQGLAFRNLRAPQLEAAGGLSSLSEPKSVPFTKDVDREVTEGLGEHGVKLYVQDMALGALLANEVPVRIVTDSAAAALMFKNLCSTTRTVHVQDYQEAVCLLLLGNQKSGSEPFISVDGKEKTIYMGGSINATQLVPALAELSTDAFLEKGVLPLWGSGDTDCVYLSSGFEQDATVKHGFAYSPSGFCRMFMGSVAGDGSVVSEYSMMPNGLPLPKAVVMFAEDSSNAIPAASALEPAQAAFYYAAACAPAGCTQFEAAAQVVMQMAEKVPFYMVNKAAFADAAMMREAAANLPGQKGGATCALGIKVVDVPGGETAVSGAEAEATAKALADKAAARCKTLDAVLAAGPPLPKKE